jgi:hypothetical protein
LLWLEPVTTGIGVALAGAAAVGCLVRRRFTEMHPAWEEIK